jgi:hypothetical protein
MGRSLESLTLFKSIPCRFSEGFQNLYNSVADYGSLLGLAKELIVVIVVVAVVVSTVVTIGFVVVIMYECSETTVVSEIFSISEFIEVEAFTLCKK